MKEAITTRPPREEEKETVKSRIRAFFRKRR